MTNDELRALRLSCHTILPGHAQPAAAEEFAAMAQWCASNGIHHDYYGEGELIQGFEQKIARLLGAEAGLFCITGTLAQATALRLACMARGNRLVALHPSSHILKHERSNYQLLDHFDVIQLGDPFKTWSVDDLKALSEPLAATLYELPMREIGGQLPSWENLDAIKAHCRAKHIHLHMDGARLWEAQCGFGRSLEEIAAGFDSVYVSFYKGIGGLGGAMLLGRTEFIDQARVWMQRQGGNVFRRSPYVVCAAMQFEQRLAAMPAYFQRTQWLYGQLQNFPQFKANPSAPQSNMLHLYLPVDPQRATDIRNAVAREHKVWLFGKAVSTALPGQCSFEWYVGDQLLKTADADVRKALALLATAVCA